MTLNGRAQAQAIAAGGFHNCAVSGTGGVVCWGVNDAGQIGDNSVITRPKPVNVSGAGFNSLSLAGGFQHTCMVENTGAVKCWGKNDRGQLGDNSITNRLTPTAVSGLASGQASTTAGDLHTCALSSAGGVKCWGYNVDGQLGNSSNVEQHVPVDVTGLGSGVSAIAAGYNHTCAVTGLGAAKCWGSNEWWQLGDGSEDIDSNLPVDVAGLSSGVTAIAGGNLHTCAIVSGGVKCWGYNVSGAVGDGTNDLRKTAVNVSGLTSGASTISAGSSHTCALLTGGTVKCWGDNTFGQLGDGTSTSSNVPVTAIASGAIAIAAGAAHTCALTGSGTSVCWGNNPSGQLGDGTIGGPSFVPVSTQYPTATSTTVSSSGTPSTFGDNVTFTATVSGGANGATVTFQNGGITIPGCGSQTVAAGAATCTTNTLSGGTFSITAIYQGNSTTLASMSAAFSQTVSKADQTIAFDPLASKSDTDPPFSISATASSGLAVSFGSLTPAVCTVSGTTVTIVATGSNTCTIAANQAGNGNYNAAPQVTQSFSITATGPALALVSAKSRKTHGAAGDFDIPLNPATAIGGAIDVESRAIGAGHKIVFTFNVPITATGSVVVTDKDSNVFSGAVATPAISGNDIVVTVTGIPDNRRALFTLSGVNAGINTFSAAAGFLIGDVNNSRSVTGTDVGVVRGRSGQAVTSVNFKSDLNASGTLTGTDVSVVRPRSGLVIP
ncbi:MAG: Ig-like domain repeat protein [Betaproteobacteria bacterium]|nr:Ig-like domain repeat protein [Betaproteobacteria bacterium]